MTDLPPEVQVYKNPEALAQAAARLFVQAADQALTCQPDFSVALAGGSTPRVLYRLLSQPEYSCRLAWDKIHLFWGDERCVPPNHPDSNYGMVKRALLEQVGIPSQNIHRMAGEDEASQARSAYETLLRNFFISAAGKTFDLVLLGMGDDGHTASLFPGTPALEETKHWVAVVEHTQPPLPLVNRLTLTLPAINAASQVIILVAGESKADRLRQVFTQPAVDQPRLPVQRVQPTNGQVLWLLDASAAQCLDRTA